MTVEHENKFDGAVVWVTSIVALISAGAFLYVTLFAPLKENLPDQGELSAYRYASEDRAERSVDCEKISMEPWSERRGMVDAKKLINMEYSGFHVFSQCRREIDGFKKSYCKGYLDLLKARPGLKSKVDLSKADFLCAAFGEHKRSLAKLKGAVDVLDVASDSYALNNETREPSDCSGALSDVSVAGDLPGSTGANVPVFYAISDCSKEVAHFMGESKTLM